MNFNDKLALALATINEALDDSHTIDHLVAAAIAHTNKFRAIPTHKDYTNSFIRLGDTHTTDDNGRSLTIPVYHDLSNVKLNELRGEVGGEANIDDVGEDSANHGLGIGTILIITITNKDHDQDTTNAWLEPELRYVLEHEIAHFQNPQAAAHPRKFVSNRQYATQPSELDPNLAAMRRTAHHRGIEFQGRKLPDPDTITPQGQHGLFTNPKIKKKIARHLYKHGLLK